MPNYLDHLDLIDANGRSVIALLQDRETLALANENAGKILQEAQARSEADTALSNSIQQEAQARSGADTALSNSIQQEAQARSDADTALSNSIQQEAQTRSNADTALTNDLIKLHKNICEGIIVLIGDSYVHFHDNDSFALYLCNALGKTLNTDFFIFDLGGAGFVANGLGKTFGDLLNDSIAQIGNNAPKVSMVLFCGGANDNNYPTVRTAAITTLTNAKTAYPNAAIHLFNVDASVQPAGYKGFLDSDYANACCETMCAYQHIGNILKLNPLAMMSDGIHPTIYGEKLLGGALYTALMGGKISCTNQYINIGQDLSFYVNANMDMARITVVPNNRTISFATYNGITCNGVDVMCEYTVGNTDYPTLLKGNNAEFLGGVGQCLLHLPNSDWLNCQLYVTVSEGKVQVRPLYTNANGYLVIPTNTAVEMSCFTFEVVVPTIFI